MLTARPIKEAAPLSLMPIPSLKQAANQGSEN
jgi:hypothetical protein